MSWKIDYNYSLNIIVIDPELVVNLNLKICKSSVLITQSHTETRMMLKLSSAQNLFLA